MDIETLEVARQALLERSEQLRTIMDKGLTLAIREAAKEDLVKTHNAWHVVESELLKLEEKK